MPQKKLNVLFLCTGNSCRRQMAESFANNLCSSFLRAYSAGTKPKGVDPLAVRSMQEVGLDISGDESKSVDDLKDVDFNLVITVCGDADENCPVFGGSTKVIYYGFDDPPKLALNLTDINEKLKHYRRVRDEIKNFVLSLPLLVEKD